MEHRLFDIGGLTYSVYQRLHAPDAPSVLLLHGFAGSGRRFLEQAHAHLPFQLFSLDLLGHGETDVPLHPTRYTSKQQVGDVLEIIEKLGLSRPHLIGYSMGGRLALRMALTAKKRFSSLSLLSVSPGISNPSDREIRRVKDEEDAQLILESPKAFFERFNALPLFGKPSQNILSDQLFHSPRGLANSLRGFGQGHQADLWREISGLYVPTLWLAGEKDPKYVAELEMIGKQAQNVQTECISGAFHRIHIDQPDLVFSRIFDFIKTI